MRNKQQRVTNLEIENARVFGLYTQADHMRKFWQDSARIEHQIVERQREEIARLRKERNDLQRQLDSQRANV